MIQSSLYVHIPYCKQACTYCDFHFSTNIRTKAEVLRQMHVEIQRRAKQAPWNALEVKSLYFGGGTPSLLSSEELKALIDSARTHFSFAEHLEVTLEANPDDVTEAKLEQWYQAGVNRLSVGIQSFQQNELEACNRAHTGAEAHNALQLIRSSKIDRFSIDLIYGMIGSTLQSWKDNLATALTYAPDHISCYSLTVEEKTALAHQVSTGKVQLPEEDGVLHQFDYLREWAAVHGYEHYELSNFCIPGHRSVHNQHYWSYQPYLGIGPGAHSFDGKQRFWNVSNNIRYAKGQAPEGESLTLEEQINERLMVRLRTADGFRFKYDLPQDISSEAKTQLLNHVNTAMQNGELHPLPDGFKIAPENWMRSDQIIANLFIDTAP